MELLEARMELRRRKIDEYSGMEFSDLKRLMELIWQEYKKAKAVVEYKEALLELGQYNEDKED